MHAPHITTVWACEKTVVMVKQPGHFTSMKKERGPGTRVWREVSDYAGTYVVGWRADTYLELVFAGLSLRARVEEIDCEDL